MTTKTIDGEAETPAERYNHIKALVGSTPSDAPAPITYSQAIFVLDYVANDTTEAADLRADAKQVLNTIICRLRRRELAAANGGQA